MSPFSPGLAQSHGCSPTQMKPWKSWGRRCNSLAIMAPGFSADCLETLEELAMEGRESFEEHGGGSLTMCLV